MDSDTLDKVLPQTQCGECGYDGCRPYAEALANDETSIDLCPPGGVVTLKALAKLLNKDHQPFEEAVKKNTRPAAIAQIREDECIGCTKCIQACPVDAIIGRNKRMHSVITELCTGCRLCIEPCPVDCIDMIEKDNLSFDKDKARHRFLKRKARLKREETKKHTHYLKAKTLSAEDDIKAKQDYIRKMLERKKASAQ